MSCHLFQLFIKQIEKYSQSAYLDMCRYTLLQGLIKVRQISTKTVNQSPKDTSFKLSPLLLFGMRLSSFMHILISSVIVSLFRKSCAYEKYEQTNRVFAIYTPPPQKNNN